MTLGPLNSMWSALVKRSRLRTIATIVVLALLASSVTYFLTRPPSVTKRDLLIAGTPEPTGPVKLDASLYLPEGGTPAPAVLLAHGLGGNKRDLDGQAIDLARRGYVVLAYSARGFGDSGGLVHLNSPKYEVADAQLLVSYLATLAQVRKTAPNDPVVGVAGSSYGGALALSLAGTDPRIDSVAADITYNNLERTLFPNNAVTQPGEAVLPPDGVFKKLWTGYLFQTAHGSGKAADASPACGRVAVEVCDAFSQVGKDAAPNAKTSDLLWAASPGRVAEHITAPTLLIQGEQDSLFPLTESDATAHSIAAVGTPVRMVWRSGGHDGGNDGDINTPIAQWFDAHLKSANPSSGQVSDKSAADKSFELADQRSTISTETGRRISQILHAPDYPGLATAAAPRVNMSLSGREQRIAAPGGGVPAAVSSLPGLGGLLQDAAALGAGSGGALSALSVIDGQNAHFDSVPLANGLRITGGSTVKLRVTSTAPDATLFVSLADLSSDSTVRTPASLVAPVRLTGLKPGQSVPVTVTLPWVVADIPAGHRVRIVVATSDLAYQLPADARDYDIALDGSADQLSAPSIVTTTVRGGASLTWLIVGVAAMLGCVVLVLVLNRRGPHKRTVREESPIVSGEMQIGISPDTIEARSQAPVVIENLVKEYGDGYRAVDGASLRVERGQVVGLLGPNGAGKTTLLRTLVGLIRPTSGKIELFGEPVTPGADVLRQVGALIEGPGFLPHLSGRRNLALFWAASGRRLSEAQLETALEIAGLGSSIDRKVKTYSHGMKQRLAIAQAMLGLPDLLVLDEPTNGLDPPQIAEMREVMRSYAETGRTVIVSSHLLSEVEQTCTHVVVMHKGVTISAGRVADVAGADRVQLAVDDPERAAQVLAEAGIDSQQVPVRRALEGAFLDLVGER